MVGAGGRPKREVSFRLCFEQVGMAAVQEFEKLVQILDLVSATQKQGALLNRLPDIEPWPLALSFTAKSGTSRERRFEFSNI
jgi:hypothetical protein